MTQSALAPSRGRQQRREGHAKLIAALVAWLVLIGLEGATIASSADKSLVAPGGGVVHAIVIGIDDYQRFKPLKGAVADSRDIADVLGRLGVTDLVHIVDGAATRESIEATFSSVLERTKHGDLVFLTYAGHGSQQPQAGEATEADGLDETFVLGGFGRWGQARAERLLDDEINAFLHAIASRGGQVLFLADSCHGGGMSKGTEPPADADAVRGLYRVTEPSQATEGGYSYFLDDAELTAGLPKLDPSESVVKELPGLTMISAVEPNALAPEIRIDGQPTPRGAASYALARALEGEADKNGDGATTRAELLGYLGEEIWTLTSKLKRGRQVPVMEPHLDEALDMVVFRHAPLSGTQSAGSSVENDDVPGTPPGTPYDALLEPLMGGQRLGVRLMPPKEHYTAGDQVDLIAERVAGRWISIVDITSDGKMQLVFPQSGLGEQALEHRYVHRLEVVPPFGADTLLILATRDRSAGLLTALRAMDGQLLDAEAAGQIGALLGADDRVGVVAFVTRSN